MQIEAANAENSLTNYIMAALGVSAAAFIAWHYKIPIDPRAENALPLAFIPLAIAAIGLWYLLKALLDSLRIWRFGVSTLDADAVAVLGQRFEGVLTSSKPLDANASYSLHLVCIETLYDWHPTGQRQSYSQVTRWKGSYVARPEPIRPNGGLSVSFEIPANCPATTSPDSGPVQQGVRWVLEARHRGLGQYYSLFRLNVHATAPGSRSEQHQAT